MQSSFYVEEEEEEQPLALATSTAIAGTSAASVGTVASTSDASSSSTPVAANITAVATTTTATTSDLLSQRAGQFSILQLLSEHPHKPGNNITYSLDYSDYNFVHGSLQDPHSPDSTTQ